MKNNPPVGSIPDYNIAGKQFRKTALSVIGLSHI